MIEPTVFKTRDEIHKLKQDGIPLFALCLESSSLWLSCVGLFPQNKLDRAIFMTWRAKDGGDPMFSIDGFYIYNNGLETFMDYLFERYPDYAELFLFHPEWLK